MRSRSKLPSASKSAALSLAAGAGLLLFTGQIQATVTTIFSDTFANGSTLNAASVPSGGNSTSYVVASTKNQSPAASITTGHLKFGIAATTSGVDEVQAKFATTPVNLNVVNDSVRFVVTFTNSNILNGNRIGNTTPGNVPTVVPPTTGSAIWLGLYASGGTTPVPSNALQSAGLTATAGNPLATGNAQLWQGYVSQIAYTGGASRFHTRPAQTGAGTTSANQELFGNGAGGGLYANPIGTTFASSTSISQSLSNSTYTYDFLVKLTAANTVSLTSNLYTGTSNTGTPIYTNTATGVNAANFFNGFDGMAIGYRETYSNAGGTVAAPATFMDVNSITVLSDLTTSSPIISLTGSGPTGYGSQITNGSGTDKGTFTPTGNVADVSGGFAKVNNINTGSGAAADYIVETGLAASAPHVYWLKLKLGANDFDPGIQGNYTSLLTQLIGDINTAGGHTGSITASAASATAGFTLVSDYDLVLTVPANGGFAPNEYLGFNFNNESDATLKTMLVSDILVVPEPTSVGLAGLGMLGLMQQRRKRR